MFVFRVLGTVDLRGPDGRRVGSVLNQPKRLALLTMLAVEAPQRLQRDEVMARLWPEMPEDRARGALRQSLYYLGRSLGPGVVVGKGTESIGIEPDKLECDAASLLRAAGEGRYADAVALYQGDLLPGFHLDDAPAPFEHWLDSRRREMRKVTAEAAWKVAEAEESAGDAVAAGVAARQACDLGQWGEPALRKLLRLLVRTGDASGAREAYEEFAGRLQREYGQEPGPETREILEQLSTVGDEPEMGPVTAVVPPTTTTAAQTGAPVSVGGRRRGERWRAPFAATLAGLLVVALWTFQSAGGDRLEAHAAPTFEDPRPHLYLEPVRDLEGSQSSALLAEAIGGELAARLIETEGFIVVATDPDAMETSGPGLRLEPTVREVDGAMQLSVLVLDHGSDAVLDRLTVHANRAGSLPETLAGRMAPQIRRGAGDLLAWQGLTRRGIQPAALQEVRTASEEVDAGDRFVRQRAIASAATSFRTADSLLAHAESMDPSWLEPTLRRAELALRTVWLYLIPPDDRPEQAHREILRGLAHAEAALERRPTDPRAMETRGMLHHRAAQTAMNPEAKTVFEAAAEADLQQAIGLDPGLPRAWAVLSTMAERRGDYTSAYHRARRAYATDRDLRAPPDLLARLFTNALETGDEEGAAEWCTETYERHPGHWLGPYCDLTRMAWLGPWSTEAGDSLLAMGLEGTPDGPYGEAVRTRFHLLHAVVLARAGEDGAARAALASVEESWRGSVDVLELMAWVETALGETEPAKRLLAAAADLNPASERKLLNSRRFAGLSSYALVGNDE